MINQCVQAELELGANHPRQVDFACQLTAALEVFRLKS
jgi:hypothetical protein